MLNKKLKMIITKGLVATSIFSAGLIINDISKLNRGFIFEAFAIENQEVVIKDLISTVSQENNSVFVLSEDGNVWDINNQFNFIDKGSRPTNSYGSYQIHIRDIKKVVFGLNHSLFLKNDGTLLVAGSNARGQLGTGNNDSISNFQAEIKISNIVDIANGINNSFVLKSDGTVWATGFNAMGQLGLGDTTDRNVFTKIPITNVKKVIAGGYTIFFIKTDGTIWTTGNNTLGQSGLGDITNRKSPTKVPITDVKDITSNSGFTLFLKNDGTVWGTGSNSSGQLGFLSISPLYIKSLTQVPIDNVEKVTIGADYSFFIKNDGTVWAVGENSDGQLGLGDYTDRTSPTKIPITNVKEVITGCTTTFFIKNDGSVWATGSNASKLFNNSTIYETNVPVLISWNLIKTEFYTLEEAIESVIKAENTKLQPDIYNAKQIVSSLPNSPEKTNLTNRLNAVQAFVNNQFKLIEATQAVEVAETTKLQADVDSARTLVNQLANGTDKSSLNARLDEIQSFLNYQSQVVIATDAVIKAESSKTQSDIDNARALVNALPTGTDKTNLTNRLNALQSEIDYVDKLVKATEAVVKAEASKLQSDVNSSKTLVNALPNSTEKSNLINRLDVVQAEIDYAKQLQEATDAVQLAEITKTQNAVDLARILVNALNDGIDKTNLNDRLNVIQNIIDLEKQIYNATISVENAEKTKLQVDVDSARTLVSVLPNGTNKTNLTNRLNAVQTEIELGSQLQEATEAVSLAEISKDQDTVNIAQNLIDSLKDSPEKTALQQRLDAVKNSLNNENVQDKIDDINNKLDEIKDKINNGTATDSDLTDLDNLLNDLDDLVNQLPNGTEIPPEVTDTQSEADLIKKLAEATQAVKKAENSKLQSDVNSARTLVNVLPNGTDKTNLNNRLDKVEQAIYNDSLNKALEAVDRAETDVTIANYNTALGLVNKLKPGADKTLLLNRLDAVLKKINALKVSEKELGEATRAVEKAEIFKRDPYISTAINKVNLLPNCSEKTALLQRLDEIQSKLDSDALELQIKTADIKLKYAEKLRREPYLTDAINAVTALPNCSEKDGLLLRLQALNNTTVITGNTQADINKATKYIANAEDIKTDYFYNKALEIANKLKNSPEKTSLLNRLAVIDKEIHLTEEEKAIMEAIKYIETAEKYKYSYYINKATELINTLTDSSEKTELILRIKSLK